MAKIKFNEVVISGEVLDLFNPRITPIKSKDADGVEFDNEMLSYQIQVETGKDESKVVDINSRKFNFDGTPSQDYMRKKTLGNDLETRAENEEGGELVRCTGSLIGNVYYNKEGELVQGYRIDCQFCNRKSDSKFNIYKTQNWKAYALIKEIVEMEDSLNGQPYLLVTLAINKWVKKDRTNAAWSIVKARTYDNIEVFKKMYKVGDVAFFKGKFNSHMVEETGAFGECNTRKTESFLEIKGGKPPVQETLENGEFSVLDKEICSDEKYPFTKELVEIQEKAYEEELARAKEKWVKKQEEEVNTSSQMEITDDDIPF